MFFSNRNQLETPDRHEILAAAMEASSISMDGFSHEEAAKILYESVKTNEKNYCVSFAAYGIAATCYDVIADTTIEAVRKFLAAQKKIYRGLKVYVRVFAPFKYNKKNYLAVTAPGLILWEIDGVTDEIAEEITRQVSDIVGFPLKTEKK